MKKLIPAWKDGLDLASAKLGGDDILCCTTTGDGKSAAFSVPILLTEYNKNPALYAAGLPTRSNPVGVIVTPTKGLAANIVIFGLQWGYQGLGTNPARHFLTLANPWPTYAEVVYASETRSRPAKDIGVADFPS
jgi:hypothetical protein